MFSLSPEPSTMPGICEIMIFVEIIHDCVLDGNGCATCVSTHAKILYEIGEVNR